MRARSRVWLCAIAALACAVPPASAAGPGDPCLECPPENIAPTIEVSASTAVPVRGQVVTFTASVQDADGDTLTVEWDLDDGTAFDDGTGTTASKAYSTLGGQSVRARVSDGTASSTDSITVEVVNRAPVASFSVSPANPKTGDTVTFTSTAGDPDGDAISTRVWDLDNDGTYGEPGETGNSVSRAFTPAGSYPVRHKVTDSFGFESAVTLQNVTVANRPPVASFTTVSASPLSGEQVTFDSTASSDPDGTVSTRTWDLDDDGVFGELGETGTVAQKSFALPGTFTVTLRVTDNLGAVSEQELTVTVGNRLPSASFTASPGAALTGDTIAFDASASSDPESVALASYEWDFDGNGTYDASGSTPTTSHAYPISGAYLVQVRVTDAHGGQAVTARTVNVAARPVATTTGGGSGTSAGATGASTGTGGGAAGSDQPTAGGGQSARSSAPVVTAPSSLKLKLDRKGRFTLKGVGITCPAGCVVTISAKAGKRTLAKLAFTGSRQAPRLSLTKKGRGLLKRRRRTALSITITAAPADGAPVTRRLGAALRR